MTTKPHRLKNLSEQSPRFGEAFMRESRFLSLWLVWLLVFSCPVPASAQDLKPGSQSCDASSQRTILLNLQDKDANFINGLQATDLTLTEDKTLRNIVRLETVTDAPLSVVILIHNGATQYALWSQAKLAAQKFVEWNLRNKGDRAALVSFSRDATVEEDLTSDWTKLQKSISRLRPEQLQDYLPGPVTIGRTPPIQPGKQSYSAISAAVWASTDGILKSVTNSRRMIVVLMNDEQWSIVTRLSEAIAYAGANGVAVFTIDTKQEGHTILGRSPLTELAEDTGGRSFGLRKVQDLPEVLQKIDRQARSHYVLTYCTANPHPRALPVKIEIEIKNSQLRNSVKRIAYPRSVL